MKIHTLAISSGILVAVIASACTSAPTGVRGFENAPGSVVAQVKVNSDVSADMPAGTSSFVGASVDGSLMGFLGTDAVIRWYRIR
ncbi:MAG: hypothetical protein HYX56_07210 [Chloroflexi bacterium]|nr:hypothetical protein [Chloroflexota bacterium]